MVVSPTHHSRRTSAFDCSLAGYADGRMCGRMLGVSSPRQEFAGGLGGCFSRAEVCVAGPLSPPSLMPFRFLYILFVALDANFRLKAKLRANEKYDPSLGPGFFYFVPDGPYKQHLSTYVSEEEVNLCAIA